MCIRDSFKDGKAVPINFFDAIKAVYGLSMVDIAVLLDVTFGVVYRAKTQGFSSKRIKQFSNALRVPENLLLNTTTGDFEELEQCKKDFFQSYDKKLHFQAMPEWKMRLANDISSTVLHCPIHIAKQLSSVDHLFWTNGMALDAYTEDEIAFIHYLQKTSGKHLSLIHILFPKKLPPEEIAEVWISYVNPATHEPNLHKKSKLLRFLPVEVF